MISKVCYTTRILAGRTPDVYAFRIAIRSESDRLAVGRKSRLRIRRRRATRKVLRILPSDSPQQYVPVAVYLCGIDIRLAIRRQAREVLRSGGVCKLGPRRFGPFVRHCRVGSVTKEHRPGAEQNS